MVLLAVALMATACSGGGDAPEQASPTPDRAGGPGELVEVSAREGEDVPSGALAWDVTYESTGVQGEPVATSGVVYAPDGPAPEGGRPVLSWAHGTTGVADECAPSRTGVRVPYLGALLDAGYVVAATDYEGMGTPGPHPYLVGSSEAHGVLDAARAAQRVEGSGAGSRLVVFGHSQGGHAALFSGQLAASYAPELDVLGVVAAAPAAELGTLLTRAGRFSLAFGLVASAAYAYAEAYPDIELADVLTPEAIERVGVAEDECLAEVLDAFADEPVSSWSAADPLSVPAWADRIEENVPGADATPAPLLVVQGDSDIIVPVSSTDDAVERICATGTEVDYRRYDGADHGGVLTEARSDVLSWLADRLAGEPAASTCE